MRSTSNSKDHHTTRERGPAITSASSADSPSTSHAGLGLHKRGLSNDGHSPAESNASSQLGREGTSVAPEDQRSKKRRAGGPGSRGVANLTPEQLAKKRANDREAQRAIRERTKNQIENLEKRIRELTSQKPYQELQAVIRAKEAVEAENADIKNRLASVMALIQPIVGNEPVPSAEGAYASPVPTYMQDQPGLPPASAPANNASTPGSTSSPAVSAEPWQHGGGLQSGGSSTQASPSFSQVKMINQQRQDLLHSMDIGSGEQLKLDFLLDPAMASQVNRMQTGANGAQDTPNFRHLPLKHDWNGVPFPAIPGAPALQQGPQQQHQQPPQQQQQRIDYSSEGQNSESWIGTYSAPIKNCAPTCPLDQILLDFLHERRQRAAEGVPAQDIVGPRYPSVSSLLNPANSAYSHPLSKVFTDILTTFPGISTLPEKVAVLYIMFLIMRWQISPTRENYNLLPSWVHPRPAQIYSPHPAWVDHVPFPRMRESIAQDYNPDEYLFENFFIPFTSTICLNWPYEPTDTLLQSPDGDELIINPVFERHLRRLENWTLGEAFQQTFPQLEGTYNLKRDGSSNSSLGNADPRRRSSVGGL